MRVFTYVPSAHTSITLALVLYGPVSIQIVLYTVTNGYLHLCLGCPLAQNNTAQVFYGLVKIIITVICYKIHKAYCSIIASAR